MSGDLIESLIRDVKEAEEPVSKRAAATKQQIEHAREWLRDYAGTDWWRDDATVLALAHYRAELAPLTGKPSTAEQVRELVEAAKQEVCYGTCPCCARLRAALAPFTGGSK